MKKIIFLLTLAIFLTACPNSDSQKGFEGTWKMVAVEEAYYPEGSRRFPVEPDNQYWCFDDSSMVKLFYPRYCEENTAFNYSFDSISLVLKTQNVKQKIGGTFIYGYEFLDDTLKIIDFERGTSELIPSYYFVRSTIDEVTVNYLRENLVDWSHYSGKWEFVNDLPDSHAEEIFVCPIVKPDILDLTDKSKVLFNRNILTYQIDGQAYEYTFSHASDDTLLWISPVCPERESRESFKYRRIQ